MSTGADPLRQQLKEILVRRLKLEAKPGSIADDDLLFDPGGLGLDSIDALEFVLAIEQELGLEVGNEEVAGEALGSIARLADYLRSRHPDLGEKPTPPEAVDVTDRAAADD